MPHEEELEATGWGDYSFIAEDEVVQEFVSDNEYYEYKGEHDHDPNRITCNGGGAQSS